MEARYFGATTYRFITVDPLRNSGSAAQPVSWNRYTYVDNQPLGAIDRDGRAPTQVHRGTTGLIFWLAGFDPGFAAAVARADAWTDLSPKTTWLFPWNGDDFHGFGCDSACGKSYLAIAKSINPSAPGAAKLLGNSSHFLLDQPLHGKYVHNIHPIGADNISKHQGSYLEGVHNVQELARAAADKVGLEARGGASDQFWNAVSSGNGVIVQRGNEFDVYVDSYEDAVRLSDAIYASGLPTIGPISIQGFSADQAFDYQAGLIRGVDALSFSTMPKDCGARAKDGSC
jgi:hypothetical protein